MLLDIFLYQTFFLLISYFFCRRSISCETGVSLFLLLDDLSKDFWIFVLLFFRHNFVILLPFLTAAACEICPFSVVWSSLMDSSSLGEYYWTCLGLYFRWLNFSNLHCFKEQPLDLLIGIYCVLHFLKFLVLENGFQILFYVFDFTLQVGDCFVTECYDILPFRFYVGKRDLDPPLPYCVTSPKASPNLYQPSSAIQTSDSIVMQKTYVESPDESSTWQICDSNINV